MSIKDVGCKRSVGSEPLSAHCFSKPSIMLGHISHVVSLRVHDHVSICLLEPQKQVHHLQLPLDDEPRLRQDICCWMLRVEDCIGILRDVDWCKQIVVCWVHLCEGRR